MVSLLAGVALIAAACGPGGTEAQIGDIQGQRYSIADQAALIVECLRERGFSAEVYEGIGVYVEGPQLAEAEKAQGECADEVEAAYPLPPPLSDREGYEAQVATAECLRDQGLTIPDPPTYETWLESDRAWSPYGNLTTSYDFWALHRVCPQPGLGLTPSTSSEDP